MNCPLDSGLPAVCIDQTRKILINIQNYVFDKFYRGKDAKTGGTGLGLSIVKGFVVAQGGTILAENRENGGAKFIIKIPVEIAELKPLK